MHQGERDGLPGEDQLEKTVVQVGEEGQYHFAAVLQVRTVTFGVNWYGTRTGIWHGTGAGLVNSLTLSLTVGPSADPDLQYRIGKKSYHVY